MVVGSVRFATPITYLALIYYNVLNERLGELYLNRAQIQYDDVILSV